MIKKGQLVTCEIESLSHDGRGIARIDGKTTFVENALPGESVSAKITLTKSKLNEATAEEILKPAQDRVKPRCQHFGQCGACNLQHMNHQKQISFKEQAVLELISHQAKTAPRTWLPPLKANEYGYRRKARLSVRYVEKKQKVLVGFREKKSRYVADLSHCHILDKEIGMLLTPLGSLVESLSIYKMVPQIEVVISESERGLIFRHLEHFSDDDLQKLQNFEDQHELKIYCQPGGLDTVELLNSKKEFKLEYEIPNHKLRLQYLPTQFTQVNHKINLAMIDQAIELLQLCPEDKVIDLFCGIGNFTLPLARHCQSVVGVEGDHAAVEQAIENSKQNKILNTQFYYANLFESVYDTCWSSEKYNKVLLDPPRAGAQEIIPLIDQWGPSRVVYVSCNPATLARDIQMFVSRGFKLDACGILDMFPQTKHVETMALLTR